MSVTTPDVKRLWAKSAGRCAFPDCDQNCILLLDTEETVVVGEMAHVIAKKSKGPRGNGKGGADTYDNLVLLCPTHHTLVDKSPDSFPEQTMLKWKAALEVRVDALLTAPAFSDCGQLFTYSRRLMSENKFIHQHCGPESPVARSNPLTDAAKVWDLRKCAIIIPNNKKVINAFEGHQTLVPIEDWLIFVEFREHVSAFERNAYERLDRDAVPRFPEAFAALIGAD